MIAPVTVSPVAARGIALRVGGAMLNRSPRGRRLGHAPLCQSRLGRSPTGGSHLMRGGTVSLSSSFSFFFPPRIPTVVQCVLCPLSLRRACRCVLPAFSLSRSCPACPIFEPLRRWSSTLSSLVLRLLALPGSRRCLAEYAFAAFGS